MANPTRIQFKVFASNPSVTHPEAFIPVFHDWIKDEARAGEILIDVADYTHVHQGPGILLEGHGHDYYYDEQQGRPGLVFSRKRAFDGTAEARLKDALKMALAACKALSSDSRLGGVSFDAGDILLKVPDRLHVTNDDASLEALKPALTKVLSEAFGEAKYTMTRVGGERGPLTLEIKSSGASVEDVLGRL